MVRSVTAPQTVRRTSNGGIVSQKFVPHDLVGRLRHMTGSASENIYFW